MKNDNTGPEYLRGEDLQKAGVWTEFKLTITKVIPPNTVKGADKQLIKKAILEFTEARSKFIVGNTNERLIKCQLGTMVANWIGKSITLYPVTGDWFGVPDAVAVRVRIPKGCPRPFIAPKNLGTDITGNKTGAK